MLWAKGVGEYVEAAKIIKEKNKNVEFHVIGFLDIKTPTAISSGQMNEWIEDGSIKYLGTSDNIQREIAKINCVVLPSFYREGVPRILLEAASMAKPIITTDNIGCRNVVDDGINGYLCEPKNVWDLVNKMEMMINISKSERN